MTTEDESGIVQVHRMSFPLTKSDLRRCNPTYNRKKESKCISVTKNPKQNCDGAVRIAWAVTIDVLMGGIADIS